MAAVTAQKKQKGGMADSADKAKALWRAGSLVMTAFSWLKSWTDILWFSIVIAHGFLSKYVWKVEDASAWDITYILPLLTLVAGLVMTNVLGYLEFQDANDTQMKILAACDCDLLYIVTQDYHIILAGKTEEQNDGETKRLQRWQRLNFRQAVWRALPLAMINFYLAGRTVFEIPACQIAATAAVVAHGLDPNATRQDVFSEHLSKNDQAQCWVQSLPFTCADKAHVSTQKFQELDFVKTQMTVFAALDNNFKDAKYERDEKHVKRNLVRLDDASNVTKLKQRIAIDLHNASKRVWYSCHCHESRWAPDTKARWQDRRQNWLLASHAGDGHKTIGGIGSGDLSAFNFLLLRQVASLMMAGRSSKVLPDDYLYDMANILGTGQTTESAYMSEVSKYTKAATRREKTMEKLLEGLDKLEQKLGDRQVYTVRQTRAGWQFEYCVALVLLVYASATIANQLIEEFGFKVQVPACIHLHIVADMMLLFVAAVFGATARSVTATGDLVHGLVEMHEAFFKKFQQLSDSFNLIKYLDNDRDNRLPAVADLVLRSFYDSAVQPYTDEQAGQTLGKKLKIDTVSRSLALGPRVLAWLVFGILLFGWTCTGVAHLLMPRSKKVEMQSAKVAYLNASMCGPLCLFAQLKQKSPFYPVVKHLCASVQRQIFFRGVLVSALLATSFLQPGEEPFFLSLQCFMGLVFNRDVSPFWPVFLWLILWGLHGASGYFAIDMILSSAKKHDEKKNEKQDVENPTQASALQKDAAAAVQYDTFAGGQEPSRGRWSQASKKALLVSAAKRMGPPQPAPPAKRKSLLQPNMPSTPAVQVKAAGMASSGTAEHAPPSRPQGFGKAARQVPTPHLSSAAPSVPVHVAGPNQSAPGSHRPHVPPQPQPKLIWPSAPVPKSARPFAGPNQSAPGPQRPHMPPQPRPKLISPSTPVPQAAGPAWPAMSPGRIPPSAKPVPVAGSTPKTSMPALPPGLSAVPKLPVQPKPAPAPPAKVPAQGQ